MWATGCWSTLAIPRPTKTTLSGRCGLGIVAALPQLHARLQQTVAVLRASPLQVRIGIHTGLVVVSDMGGGGYRDPMAIVGETPNIAARLQGLAEPNTELISEATHRLV